MTFDTETAKGELQKIKVNSSAFCFLKPTIRSDCLYLQHNMLSIPCTVAWKCLIIIWFQFGKMYLRILYSTIGWNSWKCGRNQQKWLAFRRLYIQLRKIRYSALLLSLQFARYSAWHRRYTLDAFQTRDILYYDRILTEYSYICCCRFFKLFSTAIWTHIISSLSWNPAQTYSDQADTPIL